MNLDISLSQILSHLVHLLVAYGLAFPIGWDREEQDRSAGIRTFPLVAVGACAYTLVGIYTLDGSDAHSRIIYGLITGIGFIGGGAILKNRGSVHGTATAASIWSTGAIGTAVALDRLEIAIVLAALTWGTLRFGPVMKSQVRKNGSDAEGL